MTSDLWLAAAVVTFLGVMAVTYKLDELDHRYSWWFTFAVGMASLGKSLMAGWWATSIIVSVTLTVQLWRRMAWEKRKTG